MDELLSEYSIEDFEYGDLEKLYIYNNYEKYKVVQETIDEKRAEAQNIIKVIHSITLAGNGYKIFMLIILYVLTLTAILFILLLYNGLRLNKFFIYTLALALVIYLFQKYFIRYMCF